MIDYNYNQDDLEKGKMVMMKKAQPVAYDLAVMNGRHPSDLRLGHKIRNSFDIIIIVIVTIIIVVIIIVIIVYIVVIIVVILIMPYN